MYTLKQLVDKKIIKEGFELSKLGFKVIATQNGLHQPNIVCGDVVVKAENYTSRDVIAGEIGDKTIIGNRYGELHSYSGGLWIKTPGKNNTPDTTGGLHNFSITKEDQDKFKFSEQQLREAGVFLPQESQQASLTGEQAWIELCGLHGRSNPLKLRDLRDKTGIWIKSDRQTVTDGENEIELRAEIDRHCFNDDTKVYFMRYSDGDISLKFDGDSEYLSKSDLNKVYPRMVKTLINGDVLERNGKRYRVKLEEIEPEKQKLDLTKPQTVRDLIDTESIKIGDKFMVEVKVVRFDNDHIPLKLELVEDEGAYFYISESIKLTINPQ